MPPMALHDTYGDGAVHTHRTVTRYRVKRPSDDYSSRDSLSDRDNLVEVDQEPTSRRNYEWDRFTRSSDHLPEQRLVVRQRPEAQGALVTRPDYSYDDDEVYRRRRYEDDRRRQEAAYYQGAVVPHDSVSQGSYSSSSESEHGERKKHHKKDRVQHSRHVAEGALVGAVGAEILRKSQGRGSAHRNRNVAAGAVLGGGVVEAISRARSRRRSSSNSPERRGRRHSDEHDRRSSSHEKLKKYAEYAAGAVAVGAIANYALKKRRQSTGRRSKSRSKSRSRSRSQSRGRHTKKEEEDIRKKRLAAAGLGTAAIAAAGAAYARSRSRKRSQSRPGSPNSHHSNAQELMEKAKEHKGALAVAGIGAAGLAAYAQKKHKEAEARKSRSRSHSRKRSRSGTRQANEYDSDGEMVAYGSDPVPVDDLDSHHSGRRSRSRSHSRPRSRRPSMSDKIKGTAEGLLAAGAGAFGANELRKKYEERKAEREEVPAEHKHNHDHRNDYQNDAYYPNEEPLYSPPASGVYSVHDPYAPQPNSRTSAYNPAGRDNRDRDYGRRDAYDGPPSAEDVSMPASNSGVMSPPQKRVSFDEDRNDIQAKPGPFNRTLSSISDSSTATEELPPRFDNHGREIHSDLPGEDLIYKIGEKIEDITSGKGSVGKLFKSFTAKFDDFDGRRS